jgi:uncharacterized LabA/DUF88 family protein
MANKTNVYIDGFNLYNGSLKKTPYKWLDLSALCGMLLPNHSINRIRYFTAIVFPFPHNPKAHLRQQVYLRALGTLPNVEVHRKGWFTWHATMMPQYPLAQKHKAAPPNCVQVQKIEEKRTDVDLASHLLVDCFEDDFDEAVVISNDSDLVPPIELIIQKFGKSVGVVNPHPRSKMSSHLIRAASFNVGTINRSVLAACQLPPRLFDAKGKEITKPLSW